ncbi:hypothetical protein A1Q2_06792 [Trichosporon asahii var. asahii CBS 8904]|uniref:Uncharacterized protein n=1 Tax=Trichosporon asahii var. asahii (strain CBS 8904) TaxID=1220162 RepID=K1WBH8_TRIAC|nr:hypothetical protein A1Q2_06792 [Trichosporon asahii var. asahii CBS 8904]
MSKESDLNEPASGRVSTPVTPRRRGSTPVARGVRAGLVGRVSTHNSGVSAVDAGRHFATNHAKTHVPAGAAVQAAQAAT